MSSKRIGVRIINGDKEEREQSTDLVMVLNTFLVSPFYYLHICLDSAGLITLLDSPQKEMKWTQSGLSLNLELP